MMTKEQCRAILKLLLAAGLPAAGLIRNFPSQRSTDLTRNKDYKFLIYTWSK